jgi:hypothetical protein
MNERMKIIVKKAHEYADQHWREDGYPFFEEYHQVFSNNYQQKFAELIVRECMTIGFNTVYKVDDDRDAVAVYQNIKEHFGVE